jgi:dCTP deaminase
MILCDREIELSLDQGRLIISPRPTLEMMESTSVDLTLGDTLDYWEFPEPEEHLGQDKPLFCPGKPGFKFADLEKKYTKQVDIAAEPFDLSNVAPRNFILGWTRERICLPHTSRLCARVEGKSSFARMGLGVHVTAPTIHAGFGSRKNDPQRHEGSQLRLEIWNVGPLRIELRAGMRICQLIVEEVREVPREGYRGQFNVQGPRK